MPNTSAACSTTRSRGRSDGAMSSSKVKIFSLPHRLPKCPNSNAASSRLADGANLGPPAILFEQARDVQREPDHRSTSREGTLRRSPRRSFCRGPQLALYRGFEYRARSRTELASDGFQRKKSTRYIPRYRGNSERLETLEISRLADQFESLPLRHFI